MHESIVFVVRSRCRRNKSSRSLSHLLMSFLLYGLEACPMKKNHLNSLDFAVNRFFIKLFRTGDINIVKSCQSFLF